MAELTCTTSEKQDLGLGSLVQGQQIAEVLASLEDVWGGLVHDKCGWLIT